MNERIKELEEQAIESYREINGSIGTMFDVEKFADLLINEVLENALYGDEFAQARDNVKQLFGVKE